ncbi:metal-dependent hydrolase [Phenylobacterium sp.]|uniref:metal-dependent hydrolase n=1 Tax=Phenylobacterium sp. TaxID=1871053 RepID=UPI0035B09E8A
MFAGHYAAAMAAKAAEPRAPLWTYVVGCQLMDIGWGALIATGVERIKVDPSLPGSALVLEHMPYTHSLPASILWSLAAALAVRGALKLPWRAAVFVGLAVFSHWLADLLVHRPDLELWFGGPKVGFGLWNYPVPEEAVEIGLLAVSGAAWAWTRGRAGEGPWAAPAFLTLLLAVQILNLVLPANPDPAGIGVMAIAVYLIFGAVAWWIDRKSRPRALPAAASTA